MTKLDPEFIAAVRAVRAKAPPGMGDFAVRELVRAALDAAAEVRARQKGGAAESCLSGLNMRPLGVD
jgi:hypothetical protein